MGTDIKRTTIYLPERLHTQLKEAAKESKRSFNSELVYALERYVQKGRKREKSVQVSPLSEERD